MISSFEILYRRYGGRDSHLVQIENVAKERQIKRKMTKRIEGVDGHKLANFSAIAAKSRRKLRQPNIYFRLIGKRSSKVAAFTITGIKAIGLSCYLDTPDVQLCAFEITSSSFRTFLGVCKRLSFQWGKLINE